jgi:4-hydroxybenzoate polyprenyltransferase/phosphoserine phosphatase
MDMNQPPLVIDLDGTLSNSDISIESALNFARSHPARILDMLLWLIQGRAYLKEKLAAKAAIDAGDIPYNSRVIALIGEERAKGRSIALATASHVTYARQIADHLGLFDRVFATEGNINLSAGNKRDRLVREFGEGGFDYAGNSRKDLPVWKAARRAYVVDPELGVEVRARAQGNVERVIASPPIPVKIWTKALRCHQWIKNLLVFVPLLASHRLHETGLIVDGVVAFVLFCLCSSSVYLLNDLFDLEYDRAHATKSSRPLASGALPIKTAIFTVLGLLLLAFAGALLFLPASFALTLGGYYILTLAYSVFLKNLMIVDVIALALFYTLRIIAGAAAFRIAPTFWMLAFSVFIFLSLAFVKRYTELRDAHGRNETEKTGGRGYYPSDFEMIASMGTAAGYISVMVLALYIQDPSTVALYRHPGTIWLACPLLLFWVSRIWLLAHRGKMHEDPVVFAIGDNVSLLVGALFAAIFWLAT